MDPLRRDDIEHARRTPPGEKLAEALKMMRFGIRLKRSSLAAQHPQASAEEVDAMLQAWRESDE